MDIVRSVIKVSHELIEDQLADVDNKDDVKRIVANELCNYFDSVYRNINLKQQKSQ